MKIVYTLSALALITLTGCASMMAALDEGSKGPAADLTGLPPGPGWTCYTASEASWSGCWRTQAECEENRANAKGESDAKGIQFGECTPGLQAACLSYDSMVMNDNGSARYENTIECAPDLRQCVAGQCE